MIVPLSPDTLHVPIFYDIIDNAVVGDYESVVEVD
jgi:hypothetical protein